MRFAHYLSLVAACVVLALSASLSAFAQDGRLTIHVTPKQAYVFVDGHAAGEANKHRSWSLAPGDHKVDVVNYGFSPESKTVTITAGQVSNLDVSLQPVTATVSAPFGAMTIEGADRDAILLNGKTPDFFVGHGDMFNHNWWWKQELVVPPGTYQMSVLGTSGEVWSGPVDVPANQRVVVDIPKGVRKTVAWSRGEKMTSVPRFKVGIASATVAVAKPTAEVSATAAQINCGDSSQLKWTSTDAPHVEITPVGPVAMSGDKAVQPTQTTTYQMTALGPGGTATSSSTVTVNTAVQANLALAPAEVRYHRVGDQVVQEVSTALNWTATNANAVSIDPLGTVDPSGNRTLQVTPRKTDPGPVDETVTYTLNATNACGGTETKTATLHIVGVIEQPDTGLALNSVYFPTSLPMAHNPGAGLVSSQQTALNFIAGVFKEYLNRQPEAHLVLMGHADKRGPQAYNQPLSERRAEVVKSFLIEQGVPADHLETQAFGKDKNLDEEQVKQLLEQNTTLTDEDRQRLSQKMHTIVLANNRRVDMVLSTTGKESTQQYPFNAEDFAKLVNRNGPGSEGGVQQAAERTKDSN
jgi:hypothetical protein